MADEREFRRAVAAVRAAGAEGRVAVSDAHKLALYGLFKQATDGDCRKAQPSASQSNGSAVGLSLSRSMTLTAVFHAVLGLQARSSQW